ncbi:unnamed protein product [Eruca vesicaria subsp. sativa]|uniref:Uncharacterized protein n=1 Tax=Eruca vesicaria subsp. sativa TaxID=29727 RepID=A0ABC8LKD4_ERUVS|nr:unnamed protein product [Eruca vesicaria subsp. sativa]
MAMRSVGSSVANSRIGRYMKRVWVEEVAQKPGQTFLVLAGSILVAGYKQAEEVREIVKEFRKERAEFERLDKLVSERLEAYVAKKDEFVSFFLSPSLSL